MPSPRQKWSELKPDTKKRKLAYYKNHEGLSAGQVARRYNAGTLGPQTETRGHGGTPEHPDRLPPEPTTGEDKHKRYRSKIKKTIDYIQEFKEAKWSRPTGNPKWQWNADRSRMRVKKDIATGKDRGIKDLQYIKAMVDIAKRDTWLDWHGIVALDYDHEDAFYYH
jgi:hypothetical protein